MLNNSRAVIESNNPGVYVDDYDKQAIVAPFNICTWKGAAQVGGAISGVKTSYVKSVSVTAHELGHNFGQLHAGFLQCQRAGVSISDDCTISEYGDLYSVMGDFSAMHYSAPHKEHAEFFESSNLLEVTESGTYTLAPLSIATSSLQALKIPRRVDDYLYIEYRRPIGWDGAFPDEHHVYQGALFHTIRGGAYTSLLIDAYPFTASGASELANSGTAALHLDQTFTDPCAHHEITVVDQTADSITVDVALSDLEFDGPAVEIISPRYNESVSGVITISADVTDDSEIDRVEFYTWRIINGSIKNVLLGTADTPTTGSIYEMTFDSTQFADCLSVLWVVAYDIYCNSTESSPPTSIYIVNNDLDDDGICDAEDNRESLLQCKA